MSVGAIPQEATPAYITQKFTERVQRIVAAPRHSYARAPSDRGALHHAFSYTDVTMRKAFDPELSPVSRAMSFMSGLPLLVIGPLSALTICCGHDDVNRYLSGDTRRNTTDMHRRRRAVRHEVSAYNQSIHKSGIKFERLSPQQQREAIEACETAANLLATTATALQMRHPDAQLRKTMTAWRASAYKDVPQELTITPKPW